jgi:hypothetical protein
VGQNTPRLTNNRLRTRQMHAPGGPTVPGSLAWPRSYILIRTVRTRTNKSCLLREKGPIVGLRRLVQNRQSRVMSLVVEQWTHHGENATQNDSSDDDMLTGAAIANPMVVTVD